MKRIKQIIIGIFAILIIGSVIFFLYRGERSKNWELARRMAEVSPRGGPPETIEGLRRAIALYEEQIERYVKEGAQTGVYWKILATRLADRNMHQDALSALERAIYFNSQDPALYNLTGVSAAVVAKSIIGFSANAEKERNHYFSLSENAYLRALELDNTYTRPMYGLGILYAFELERPQEAIPYLERNLSISPSDIPAMFVLARAHYMTGGYSQAIELYERIISRTKDKSIINEALNNMDIIRGMLYE